MCLICKSSVAVRVLISHQYYWFRFLILSYKAFRFVFGSIMQRNASSYFEAAQDLCQFIEGILDDLPTIIYFVTVSPWCRKLK